MWLIFFSYLAGCLLILSPCVLPVLQLTLLPMYQRNWLAPLWMFMGLTLSFLSLGVLNFLFFGLIQMTRQISSVLLIVIGGGILLSLSNRGPFEGYFSWIAEVTDRQIMRHPGSSFWLGLLVGGLWMPCVGLMVPGAFLLISQGQHIGFSLLILLSFCLGVGTPVLLLSYGLRYCLSSVKWLAGFQRYFQWFFGFNCLFFGFLFLFDGDLVFSSWLLSLLPQWWLERVYIG